MKVEQISLVRSGLARSADIRRFQYAGHTVITVNGVPSILKGGLLDWVESHARTDASEDAETEVTPAGLTVRTATATIEVPLLAEHPAPAPSVPNPVVPAPAEVPPAPPTVPDPTLPPTPMTAADWVAAAATALDKGITALPPINDQEELPSYAARALSPVGMTVAEALKNGDFGRLFASAPTAALSPTWAPLIEAAALLNPANSSGLPT
jgi:hypothetical protein